MVRGLYFVLFHYFGGLLPMQLLVGAIVDHFKSTDTRALMMTAQQQEWVMNMRLMQSNQVCNDAPPSIREGCLREGCRRGLVVPAIES